LNVVPPSSLRQTPPLAAPTKILILPFGSRFAAIAEMRPLIAAEPILRAPRPGDCAGVIRRLLRLREAGGEKNRSCEEMGESAWGFKEFISKRSPAF
jgi:hypothetical protein